MSDQQVTEPVNPCINSASKTLVERAEDFACELQEKLHGGANADQFRLMGHAAIAVAILEAVRALKPADLPAMTAHRDSLETERNQLDFQCKVQLAEVERLQKVVAEQALTIATLKDEKEVIVQNERLKTDVRHWREECGKLSAQARASRDWKDRAVKAEAEADRLREAYEESRAHEKKAHSAIEKALGEIGELSAALNRERDSRSIQWIRAEQAEAELEQTRRLLDEERAFTAATVG
jgi:hypothetical protein